MRTFILLLLAAVLVAGEAGATSAGGGPAALGRSLPPGGANAPEALAPPPGLVGETIDRLVSGPDGMWSVRIPNGMYVAPAGGAPNHAVPGPIVAIKGPGEDASWRGHGYLETWVACLGYEVRIPDRSAAMGHWMATITYRFEGDVTYVVDLAAANGVVSMTETCTLGPRNVFVFDATYGWQPQAGFCVNADASRHNFLYLPCHFDKAEVSLLHAALTGEQAATAPAGVALVSSAAGQPAPMVAGLWCREPGTWENGSAMGIQLWQHRQLPGDPASRHFLGPETKSDGTPNPATAAMIGQSRYEGHVTLELALGQGSRKTAWTCYALPEKQDGIPVPFAAAVKKGGE